MTGTLLVPQEQLNSSMSLLSDVESKQPPVVACVHAALQVRQMCRHIAGSWPFSKIMAEVLIRTFVGCVVSLFVIAGAG